MRNHSNKGFCLVVFVIFIALCMAGVAALFFYFNALPPISQLKNYQPTFISRIISSDGVVIKTFGTYKYKKTTIGKVPDILKKALIATEDKNFYKHSGFDPLALVRSSISNLKAGRVVEGASTITQQLARLLFLSSEKTFDRKIKELIIAYRLEKTLPKDEILEMYLNNIYLGEGAYGVAAAAEVYFNKNVENLTLPEAALIAGLPQAPSLYSPYQNMEYAKNRRLQVLERMVKMGYITEEQAYNADKSPIKINNTHRPYLLNKAPYFVDYAVRELADKAGISEQELVQGDYKIYTTLNYQGQKVAEAEINRNMARWKLTKKYQQAALVSLDVTTGKILAYAGGKDYSISQFDRITQSVRQPGSAFKVFVYTAAMENGLTPNTIYEDNPISIGDWKPANYGNKYRGRIPLYKALAISSNAVAVRLIKDIGIDNVINAARKLGITTYIAHDYTIALGSNGVKLIELTNAYGVLANGGVKVRPHAIERVENSSGQVIYEANHSYERVLDIKTAAYMVEMLKKVIQIGTGKAANIGKTAAGKTGTTDNYRDAWFIGFTPTVVTGVWVGNDNNTPMQGLTGGSIPATIWAGYMRKIESSKPASDFVYPEIILDINNKPHSTEVMQDGNATEQNAAIDETQIPEPDSNIPSDKNSATDTNSRNSTPNTPPIPKRTDSVTTSGSRQSGIPVPAMPQNDGAG